MQRLPSAYNNEPDNPGKCAFTIIMAGVLILMDEALACSITQRETVGDGKQHHSASNRFVAPSSPHGRFIDIIKSPYVLLIYHSFRMPCIIRHAHRELACDTVTGRKEFPSPRSLPCPWNCVGVRYCLFTG